MGLSTKEEESIRGMWQDQGNGVGRWVGLEAVNCGKWPGDTEGKLMENDGHCSRFVCTDSFQCLLFIPSDENSLSLVEAAYLREICALLLGRKRELREPFLHSVSQSPASQNMQYAKLAYFGIACSDLRKSFVFFC